MPEILRFTGEHGAHILIESAGRSGEVVQAGARDAVRDTHKRARDVLAQVRTVAESVAEEMQKLTTTPQQVSVELSVGVTAGAEVFVVSGSAQAAFKVTLTWTDGPPRT